MSQKSMVIGLTGQTGAGKTTVSGLLRERGIPVIDADLVARSVVEKGKQCLLDLALEFGIEILDVSGELNRRKLGAIIFSDKEKRKRFNQIIFPYIQDEIEIEIAKLRRAGEPVILLDAPTLFESKSEHYCDKIVSVIAPLDVRRQRLLERDSDLSMEQIDDRIAAQHPDEYYTSRSDFVIRNDGTLTNLRVQLIEMLEVCRGDA